jgi:hypothetical protein
MKAEIKEKIDKHKDNERSEVNTVSSLDEEEKEHLNTLDIIRNNSKTVESQMPAKIEETLVIDNKINPFSLNSQSLRIEKMVYMNL